MQRLAQSPAGGLRLGADGIGRHAEQARSLVSQVEEEQRQRVPHRSDRVSVEFLPKEQALVGLFEAIPDDRLGNRRHRILRQIQQLKSVPRTGKARAAVAHVEGRRCMDSRDDPHIVGDVDPNSEPLQNSRVERHCGSK